MRNPVPALDIDVSSLPQAYHETARLVVVEVAAQMRAGNAPQADTFFGGGPDGRLRRWPLRIDHGEARAQLPIELQRFVRVVGAQFALTVRAASAPPTHGPRRRARTPCVVFTFETRDKLWMAAPYALEQSLPPARHLADVRFMSRPRAAARFAPLLAAIGCGPAQLAGGEAPATA